jgi:hypothetical protein
MRKQRSCNTTERLLELNRGLIARRTMIGFLCTTHRNAIHYSTLHHDTNRHELQQQLDEAAFFAALIYVYSLLDQAGFHPDNEWLLESERAEFKAWAHIRHTGAHLPNGRADTFRKEFDDFMSSGCQGKSGLAGNCRWDKTSIQPNGLSAYDFYDFALYLVLQALARCANGEVNPDTSSRDRISSSSETTGK